jgi:hypothetical protein
MNSLSGIQNISPEILKERHRLSNHQILDLNIWAKPGVSVNEKFVELAKVGEFLSLADAFTDAGLKFISFKGPLLSYRLHGDATYRQYNDFDFLFDITSSEKAIQIAISRGYTMPSDILPRDLCRKKIFQEHIKDLFLYHPEKDVCIEIHWALFGSGFVSPALLNQIISANLVEMNFAGRRFAVFNPEFDLLYLVVHGGLHYFRRLKWLVDIKDFLVKIRFDENKFLLLTEQMHASKLVTLTNYMLRHHFPKSKLLPGSLKVPAFMVKYSMRQIGMKKDEDSKNIIEYLKGIWFAINVFPGLDYKLNILKSTLFASDLAHINKIPCNPLVYYLISPFYKILRGFR